MPKEAKKKPVETKKPSKPQPKPSEADHHPVRSFLKAVFNLTFARNPPTVVIKERPSWMSDALASKILHVAAPDVAHSAFDHQLLVNTAAILRDHPDTAPWIRKVKSVRRAYENAPGDTLEIDCDFRAPVALVKWELYYWLIDGDG